MIVLTGMMGFGSLAADSHISLWGSLAASAGIWGLPGQIVMAEFYAAGAADEGNAAAADIVVEADVKLEQLSGKGIGGVGGTRLSSVGTGTSKMPRCVSGRR